MRDGRTEIALHPQQWILTIGTGCDTVQDFARVARLQLRFSHVGEPEDVDRRVGKLLERR